jgi:type VI secretion system secreted protein Hcp
VALNAYLKLRGEKQGVILGSVTEAGRAGSIEVVAVEHVLSSPRDPASGVAAGKRRHSEILVTKELDRSTPRLYAALVSNENIVEWELQFWRPGSGGQEEQHYTVLLSNAAITAIEFRLPDTREPDLLTRESYEVVSFAYQKIRWTWNDGGITAEDFWTGATA